VSKKLKDRRDRGGSTGAPEVACPWCGGTHRHHSREQRDCRARARKGLPPAEPKVTPPSAPARPGNETTRYQTDPLGGNGRAHAVARMLRNGDNERLIAKRLNVNLAFVRDVKSKLEGKS
jgi:hypothetical protein